MRFELVEGFSRLLDQKNTLKDKGIRVVLKETSSRQTVYRKWLKASSQNVSKAVEV